MNSGQTVFRQLFQYLPRHEFNACVHRYRGERWAKSFSTFDQLLCLAYAQLTGRESLREEAMGSGLDNLTLIQIIKLSSPDPIDFFLRLMPSRAISVNRVTKHFICFVDLFEFLLCITYSWPLPKTCLTS
jgi:Domain of unknown function (DUF4372)